jgi:putative transcriptional regulator
VSDQIAPGLLIAVPQLLDSNFQRTVVFLLEHGEDGAFGVVLNRPSSMKVDELLQSLGLDHARSNPDARVLIGGPVQPECGLILHTEGNHEGDSRAVTPSIFVCSTPASLQRLYTHPSPRALCFAGYSGWGPGQLERELESGSWIPAPADESLIFGTSREGLWERALQQLGIDPRTLVRGGSDGGSVS